MNLLDALTLVFCVGFAFVFVRYEIVYIDTVWRGYGVKHHAFAIITTTSVQSKNNDAVFGGYMSRSLSVYILKKMASLFFLFFVVMWLYSVMFGIKDLETSFFLDTTLRTMFLLFFFLGSLFLLPLFFSKKFWYLSEQSAVNYYHEVYTKKYTEAYQRQKDSTYSKEEIDRLVSFDMNNYQYQETRNNMIEMLKREGWVQ